jgi:hypothetical protein
MSLRNTVVAEREHYHGYLPVQRQNCIIEEQKLLRSHRAANEH